MNLPNKLTLSRFALTAVFLVIFCSGIKYSNSLALVVFVAASLTDYFDGMIARRDKLVTSFGVLMDPLADKILTCSAFIAFVEEKKIAAWIVVVIVARELAITGLRLLAANRQVVLAAERYGKHKTISQIVAIITILVALSYREWGSFGETLFRAWIGYLEAAAIYVAVALTAASGLFYLWRNRNLYLNEL
ncbi:MAG TPA: CDP-diacylglycerol--glycerol-3-phosphate 3-phosphatidyltransferase [Methylomirabilota bacterium]|nr:CDP-diacylglycerol--glycerol-3-phosphate 3-phosphatidyltransferase [Methylomirabilota bacterium]